MILDSSAIVTLFLKEPGHETVRRRLGESPFIAIGAPTLMETAIVLSARLNRDMRGILSRFMEENQILTLPFTEGHYGIAVTAWLKYGKGRHSAGLNFGDCMAYAIAKAAEMPLLCIGDDFPQTDLGLVV
jgi:ribonuclease VapC